MYRAFSGLEQRADDALLPQTLIAEAQAEIIKCVETSSPLMRVERMAFETLLGRGHPEQWPDFEEALRAARRDGLTIDRQLTNAVFERKADLFARI